MLYNIKEREANISNKHKMLENPNWHEADQLAIYLNLWGLRTNVVSSREEDLNSGPLDYKSSALTNHSAFLLETSAN